MRIAIATQDMARVDAHLGWSRHLMIYEVSAEGCRHVRTASFRSGTTPDGSSVKLQARAKALKGCAMVFVADVGPDGEHMLARQHILPLRRFAGQPIAVALDALWQGLRTSRIPLLRQDARRRLGG
jgi:nitrogen fixation protein NifX